MQNGSHRVRSARHADDPHRREYGHQTADNFPPGQYRIIHKTHVFETWSDDATILRTLRVDDKIDVYEVIGREGRVYGRVSEVSDEWIPCVSSYGLHLVNRIGDIRFVLALTLHVTPTGQGMAVCAATNIAGDELASLRLGNDVLVMDAPSSRYEMGLLFVAFSTSCRQSQKENRMFQTCFSRLCFIFV